MSGEELIRTCAESNDGAAWQEFVIRFHRSISLSVLRIVYLWGGIPQQIVDDLVQETYLKLCADKCRLLRDFAVQHPDAFRNCRPLEINGRLICPDLSRTGFPSIQFS